MKNWMFLKLVLILVSADVLGNTEDMDVGAKQILWSANSHGTSALENPHFLSCMLGNTSRL